MSEKRKIHIEKIREIFPQTTSEDIEELLGQYNNDVNQVINKLSQRSEDYSWTEVKKKKTPKPTEQKQTRRTGKARTDNRRNQNANYPPSTKPQTPTEPEAEKPRQSEPSHDQQTQPYDGYNRPPYGRGRGRGYPRQGEGYGRGGYSQAPNGAPRYPNNQRYPPGGYRGNRPYGQPNSYNQTTPNLQPEVLNDQIPSPVTPIEDPPKASEPSGDVFQENGVSPQDPNTVSLDDLNIQSPPSNEADLPPNSMSASSERESSSHSPVPSESKTSKTSPGQNPPANHPRVAKAPVVQRWKVKENPPVSSPQNPQAQEEPLPPAPQHTPTPSESEFPEEQIYVQHVSQPTQTQPSTTTPPTQTQTQPPQPSHPEPLEAESPIGTSASSSQTQIPTQTHEQPPQPLSQPPSQQSATQAPSSSPSHPVSSSPLQQTAASQPAPTSPQTPLQPNPSARNQKVVILPSGLRTEEQVAFKFGNIPMMYGESKPSLSDEHGLSLGDMSYKPGPQQHRDVHNLQDYHTEPELQEPIAQVPPYGYVPYVFPYMEETQDLQRLRMGLPQPYYEPYGFRQSLDPKPYPTRGSPITGSGYGSRDKYHPESSGATQANQNPNSLSQQPAQSPQSPQIPQQQSQQAQQPPPLLPQYYNSPPVYGYSYFPGQYTYQGMATTPYPYMRNIGYYKTPGTYAPNYGSGAYGPPATPISYDDDYKYMYGPSFFAPESLTGAPIPSSKTSPVGTGSSTPGPNPQHMGGASHVPKGQAGYSSPNSATSQSNPLSSDKSSSEFKNYSAGRDTSSFYQQIPGQMPYGYPNTYPTRMVHHQHHLHQPTLQPQGQASQPPQGQVQQSGTAQGPQQPSGQQGQSRAQAPQTQSQ